MPAAIRQIEQKTRRLKSFFFEVQVPAQIAGQHLDVRLTAPDGYQAQRSYSIASVPGADLVELAIERLDDGEVSSFFHDVAAVGDTIELRGPIGGHFIWRTCDTGPLLLIGGGSGIVPLLAMLRERAKAPLPRVPALLVYSARDWNELGFRDELLAMQAADPAFRLVLITTRGPRQRPEDYDRRLDAAMLQEVLGGWAQNAAQVFVCGSNRFVEAAATGLLQAGVPAPLIRTERYGGTS